MQRRIVLIGGLLFLVASAAVAIILAAGVTGLRIPSGDPSIQGTITNIAGDSVLVEENPQEQYASAKARVRVTAESRIFIGKVSATTTARFEDLQTGQHVKVWFTGPVAQSYPLLATAEVIVILRS